MKKPLFIVLSLVVFLAGRLSAQEASSSTVSRSPNPAVAPGASSARGARGAPARPPLPPSLKENIKLKVQSELVKGYPMDITIIGIGPQFADAFILPPAKDAEGLDRLVMVDFTAMVTQVDAGYQVDFNLSYRVPVMSASPNASSTGAAATVVHYEAHTAKSTVVAKLDTPLEIVAADGGKATLTISKPASK